MNQHRGPPFVTVQVNVIIGTQWQIGTGALINNAAGRTGQEQDDKRGYLNKYIGGDRMKKYESSCSIS